MIEFSKWVGKQIAYLDNRLHRLTLDLGTLEHRLSRLECSEPQEPDTPGEEKADTATRDEAQEARQRELDEWDMKLLRRYADGLGAHATRTLRDAGLLEWRVTDKGWKALGEEPREDPPLDPHAARQIAELQQEVERYRACASELEEIAKLLGVSRSIVVSRAAKLLQQVERERRRAEEYKAAWFTRNKLIEHCMNAMDEPDFDRIPEAIRDLRRERDELREQVERVRAEEREAIAALLERKAELWTKGPIGTAREARENRLIGSTLRNASCDIRGRRNER